MIDDSAMIYSAQLKRQTIDISVAVFCKEIPGEKTFQHWKKLGKKILHFCIPEVLEKKFLPNPSPPQKSNGPLLSRT